MVDLNRQSELRGAIELLYFGYRGFTARPDRILERRGLGRVHHRILYFIGRQPGLSVKALLDVLAISKQALSAPLRQLMEMGLLGAEPDPDDRRVKRLRLTAEGARLEAELTEAQTRHLAAAFERAGPADERGWRAVMEAMAEAADHPRRARDRRA
ncbi:MAG TPA: MarR family transcriptional regulator [Caulobacteraceae bacterium]|nr:MarR family transcriptional regulator [Caulobacteraceae bacterium]